MNYTDKESAKQMKLQSLYHSRSKRKINSLVWLNEVSLGAFVLKNPYKSIQDGFISSLTTLFIYSKNDT